jgi:RND family efflux transporter MFP subunit
VRKLSLVLLVATLAGCKPAAKAPPPPPPREVEVLVMAPTEVRDTTEYLGTLLSRQSATVSPQVNGTIRKIHVKPGQKVEAGAPLLEIDAREETAAVDAARAARQSVRARLELAQSTRKRAEALFKEGLATAQEVERARADVTAAEAEDRAAGAQISQREVQLQYNVVRAPVPGTVGDVLVNVGDLVNPQTPLTTIAGAGALEVTVAVPAERARHIQPGATILELLEKDGKILGTSKVSFVAATADPRTQLVEVKALFDTAMGLRPSELVRARVVYGTRQALQIPALAVSRQSGQAFAFVVTDKDGGLVVTRRPIRLGTLGERAYVVEDGLAPGDRIAVSSLQMLRDGAPVKVAAPKAEVP